jgi:class 3 adenylate cyclase
MDALNEERGTQDLLVKIGIHEGACLAVMLNERQDYFGQTVNIAARVQGQAGAQAISATGAVVKSPAVMELLHKANLSPVEKSVELRGISDKVVIYEIP